MCLFSFLKRACFETNVFSPQKLNFGKEDIDLSIYTNDCLIKINFPFIKENYNYLYIYVNIIPKPDKGNIAPIQEEVGKEESFMTFA